MSTPSPSSRFSSANMSNPNNSSCGGKSKRVVEKSGVFKGDFENAGEPRRDDLVLGVLKNRLVLLLEPVTSAKILAVVLARSN